MKRGALAVIGVVMLVVLGGACNAPPFEIPAEETIEVPGSGVIGGNPLAPEVAFPADVITEALGSAINQSFDTQGYDKGSVKSLKLTKLSLTVTNAEQAGGRELKDLSFLETLTIFIAGGGDPIEVASSVGDASAFEPQQLTYDMPLTDAELAEAFKSSDALDLTADVETNEQPQFKTDVLVESVLTVIVGI